MKKEVRSFNNSKQTGKFVNAERVSGVNVKRTEDGDEIYKTSSGGTYWGAKSSNKGKLR